MNKKILSICLQIAKDNIHRCQQFPGARKHFSFIIQNNELIAWGTNKDGTVHKKFGYKWYSNIHSEVDAYAKSKHRIDDRKPWSIVNIRLNNQLNTMNSMPCICCQQFLTILNCSRVYCSIEGNQFNKIRL